MMLFIWRNVLCDYTEGIIFAMADNVNEAKKVALEAVSRSEPEGFREMTYDDVRDALEEDYEVHAEPYGEFLYGGG